MFMWVCYHYNFIVYFIVILIIAVVSIINVVAFFLKVFNAKCLNFCAFCYPHVQISRTSCVLRMQKVTPGLEWTLKMKAFVTQSRQVVRLLLCCNSLFNKTVFKTAYLYVVVCVGTNHCETECSCGKKWLMPISVVVTPYICSQSATEAACIILSVDETVKNPKAQSSLSLFIPDYWVQFVSLFAFPFQTKTTDGFPLLANHVAADEPMHRAIHPVGLLWTNREFRDLSGFNDKISIFDIQRSAWNSTGYGKATVSAEIADFESSDSISVISGLELSGFRCTPLERGEGSRISISAGWAKSSIIHNSAGWAKSSHNT